MAKIKSYTDISQSKKLAEILPLESADMLMFNNVGESGKVDGTNTSVVFKEYSNPLAKAPEILPCWSLASLLSVLPILDNRSPVISKTFDGKYRVVYHSTAHEMAIIAGDYDNSIDACVAMIEKLHELNLLLL